MKKKFNKSEIETTNTASCWEIDCALAPEEFVRVVNDIADNYFDEDGNYTPEYGLLHKMLAFYVFCVKESPYEELAEDGSNLFEMLTKLTKDATFHELYSDNADDFTGAVFGGEDVSCWLTFGCASYMAQEKIEQRLKAPERTTNAIMKLVSDLIGSFADMFGPETIASLNEIADKIKAGNLDADKIVEAYGKSERAKKIFNKK